MRKELDIETIKKILALKKRGLNNTEIAQEIGCGRDSVRKYVILYGDAAGLDLRTTPEKICDLWDKGYNQNEIAKALNLSYKCVRLNVLKLGLREKREYEINTEAFNVDMPPLNLNNEPVYYPEREYKEKKVTVNGKKYIDVSEVYGL